MLIRYSQHALLRVRQRAIFQEEIEKAIDLGIKSDTTDGARKSTYKTKDKILIVIYKIVSSQEIKVITVYYQ